MFRLQVRRVADNNRGVPQYICRSGFMVRVFSEAVLPLLRRCAPFVASHQTVQGMSVSVAFLLDHGANPNIKDHAGCTPLYEAVRHRHAPCASLISNAGGTLQLSKWGETRGTDPCSQLDAGLLMCQVRLIPAAVAEPPRSLRALIRQLN